MEASQPVVEPPTETVFAADSVKESANETSQITQSTQESQSTQEPAQEQTMDLSDVEVTNENIALNIIVSYINLAQKRGAFNMKESAKIWECIKKFQRASA
tara:strand:- start:262 stop:564 length:303 start_codon:yes stop_codon:yes gene_type:complete